MNRPLSRRERAWLNVGLCAAIFLPRAYLALGDQGMIWADEIFQTLEQGHRAAFGYGLVPWEFRVGARSWLLPGAIAGVMKLLAALGVTSGASLAAWVKLIFAAIAACAFHPLLRVAYAAGGLAAALLLGGAAMAFPAHLIYSGRAMSEVASTLPLAWSLWLLWPWGMGRAGREVVPVGGRISAWSPFLAGAMLGLTVLLRYQIGVLLPIVVLVVAVRRSVRAALVLAAGMSVLLLLGGMLDWLTWGHPFQALVGNLRFNLQGSGASQWGISKHDFFLRFLPRSNGVGFFILLVGFVAGLARTWPMAILSLIFLAVHSAIPHKELRFLLPVVPLFLLCAAIGLAALLAKLPTPRGSQLAASAVLALGLLAAFGVRSRYVAFAEIGQRMEDPGFGGPTSRLVWGAFSERNRLLERAGNHADLCGLAAPTMNPYWTGGYTYLHRRVPILWAGARGDYDAANYAILGPGQGMTDARYHGVAQAGDYVLYRREGVCAPPPRGSADFGRLSPAGVPGT